MSEVTTEPAANPYRGEASIVIAGRPRLLRPSFSGLVAAEEELGALFALVDRAAAGGLRLTELTALFWHCLASHDGLTREELGEAVMRMGLAAATAPLRALLTQILQGRG